MLRVCFGGCCRYVILTIPIVHVSGGTAQEAFPLRRAHKSLQAWEADCARFYKELMRHTWISAARPKFIFHVPVPILFPVCLVNNSGFSSAGPCFSSSYHHNSLILYSSFVAVLYCCFYITGNQRSVQCKNQKADGFDNC